MRSPGSGPTAGWCSIAATGCTASRPADATETSRDILATIGSPFASLRLDAPLDAASQVPLRVPQADAWHGLEQDGGFRYRWTCQDRITWNGVLPEVHPLRLRIAVPFLNQARDGFAEACTIEVGGEVLATAVHGTELVAETTLAGPVENAVILHTPAPVSPRVVRGIPDDRLLGLAIAVYPWVPPVGA